MLETSHSRTSDIQPARVSPEAKASNTSQLYAKHLCLPERRKETIENIVSFQTPLLGQVVEGVGVTQLTGVNQTHEQIAHIRPIQRPIEQGILPVKNRPLQRPFDGRREG